MTVFVELAVPSEALSVGRLLPADDGTRIELARAVPMSTDIRCLWFIGGERESTVERLQADAELVVWEIDTLADRSLVRLDDLPDEDGFMTIVHGVGGVMLDATGAAEKWTIQLRLPDHDALATLSADCEERGIDVRLHQRYELQSRDPATDFGVSQQQRATILEAHRRGYFEIPRGTSLSELAARFDVSDQAVSERLRRGLSALLAATVLDDRPPQPESDSP